MSQRLNPFLSLNQSQVPKMSLVNLTLLTILLSNCVTNGSSKPTVHFKEDQATFYTFVTPPKRFCDDKRTDLTRYNFDTEPSTSECNNLVPGIEKLLDGISAYHYAGSPTDTAPSHSAVFSFSCHHMLGFEKQKFQSFTVPHQVKRIKSKPRTTYDHHIISSTSLLQTFLDDIELKKPKNEFIANLAELNYTSQDTLRSAGFLSMRVETFYVEILPGVKPTQSVLSQFASLPSTLEGNVEHYYDFIKRFGTHVIMEASMGGQFILLVVHNREKTAVEVAIQMPDSTVQSLINEVIAMEKGTYTKITHIILGGDSGTTKNLELWASTVKNEPVPISCRYMPIGTFLEKDNKTVKSHFLQKMSRFERDFNDLKRLYFELDVIPSNSKLADFIKRAIKNEMTHVCISQDFMSTINEGIIRQSNIQLNKFGINCTIDYEDKYDYKNVLRMYNLFPDVCLSFAIKGVKCDKLIYNFPDDINCFVFFDKPGCSHHAQKFLVWSKGLINTNLPKTLSMRLCTALESKNL